MTQPIELRLADDLEKHVGGNIAFRSAAALRRLHEVNQMLMKVIAKGLDLPFDNEIAWFEWRDSAEAAINNARGTE
jgi:hypothetical protein